MVIEILRMEFHRSGVARTQKVCLTFKLVGYFFFFFFDSKKKAGPDNRHLESGDARCARNSEWYWGGGGQILHWNKEAPISKLFQTTIFIWLLPPLLPLLLLSPLYLSSIPPS